MLLKKILNSRWTYYGAALALALVAVWTQVKVHLPTRPSGTLADLNALRQRNDVNVVFILIDTLRADRLSSYGYGRPTSPFMDEIARRGVRFAHAESQSSWTKCSMASIWTTLVPPRSGITRVEDAIPDQVELPAEHLRAAGFRTGGIWRNAWVGSNFNFGQGFELYIRPTPSERTDRMELRRRNPSVAAIAGTDEDATFSAVQFIEAHQSERFFLYVHYMDVHQYVYDQVAADLKFGSGLSDSYDSAINWVDRNVAAIGQALDEHQLTRKTLVVIAADHGEGFTEHGEGHARTLYSEVTHVPLILSLPFRLEPGVVVDSQVRNVDIWPTVFDLLGVPFSGPTDGRSLVPLIEASADGKPAPASEVAVAYLDQTWGQEKEPSAPIVSVQRDGKRLIVGTKPARLNLYDHATDPTEQKSVADQQPEVVAELRAQADALLASTPPWGQSPQIQLDAFYREQLKALGYVVK
ncbi:MAG TPA: sulfatase [Terriglobales bacterium]|nr:sulfatase [Terriglobales bacterium]